MVLSDGELEIVVLSLAVWLLVALKLIDTLVVEDAVNDEERVIESPVVGVCEADADADGVLLDDSEPLAVFEALTDGETEREAGTVALTDGEAALRLLPWPRRCARQTTSVNTGGKRRSKRHSKIQTDTQA